MKYLIQRDGRYYFNRRIPEIMKDYDPRPYIRFSLKTDSRDVAKQRAVAINQRIESYWKELVNKGETYELKRFKAAMRIAKQMGFYYAPAREIAKQPLGEIVQRIKAADKATPLQIEAVLGAVSQPEITVTAALAKFWSLTKDRTLGKSADQIRKWENPRKKAVNNFVLVVGDKPLTLIIREDIITFRDWWTDRITHEQKNASSANKDLIHLKNVIETVSDHLKLNIDIAFLFKKIMFKKRFEQARLPFTNEEILTILHSPKIESLNNDAKSFLFVAAETGARPSEIVGLLPEDIKLKHKIPYISIIDRKDKPLKTPHSARTIPLVGYALEAFRNNPDGFARYRDKPDNLTNYINRFLRENHLFPSDQHSVYSFRHSFQDRILRAEAPDRVQAELMGHQFKRPKYGDGASLEQKQQWMQRISLKRQ